MALTSDRITVTTTATRLDTADTDSVSGKTITVINAGASPVDLGGSDVTSGAGYSLAAGATLTLTLGGGIEVQVIETGV